MFTKLLKKMKKYEIGIIDKEPLGKYFGESPAEAIALCIEDLKYNNQWTSKYNKARLSKQIIAVPVK